MESDRNSCNYWDIAFCAAAIKASRSILEIADVSFTKAEVLIDLATTMSASRQGISLSDICSKYAVSLRTAQRMIRSLERYFPQIGSIRDGDGTKRWRLDGGPLKSVITVVAEEIAAIGIAIEALKGSGLNREADLLNGLQQKVKALLPRERLAKLEPDFEALLEAQGLVARPGPKTKISNELLQTIAEAIKSSRILRVNYEGRQDEKARPRNIAPLGLLTGPRRYLIAFEPGGKQPNAIKTFRVEAIREPVLLDQYFERPHDFKLKEFAQKSFGVYQREDDSADIWWRFSPKAAQQASTIQFHPRQSEHWNNDGSLDIKFRASGQLEMSWHLYQWGNEVEVISPPELAERIRKFKRDDFPALP